MASIKQNFHEDVEAAINDQIRMELEASYKYLALSAWAARVDVELPGFRKFFHDSSNEEREHADIFIDYMSKRGGTVRFGDIRQPEDDACECSSALAATEKALSMEKAVNTSLLELHSLAAEKGDAQFCDFLETHFLDEQVKSSRELGGLIAKLKRAGPGLGEYTVDKDLQS